MRTYSDLGVRPIINAAGTITTLGGSRSIVCLSIEEQIMSRDMSGRFEPIYRQLIVPQGKPGPAGVILRVPPMVRWPGSMSAGWPLVRGKSGGKGL